MWALGIIPAFFFCAIAWRQGQRGLPMRDAAIRAGIITGVWVVAGAELLSLVRALSFWPVLLWWSVPAFIILDKCKGGARPVMPRIPKDRILRLVLGAGGLLLAITFVGAAYAPPNNWDVLSYHLPRQVYWMQQHSVANFSTQDWRMLAMPPLAEFAGVQLMILSGGDRWLSLIQWLAFGLTALTAAAIARDLGCDERLQAITALLVLTIPPAAMQSMSAKNDVVVAFFLCALIYQALKIYRCSNTALTEIALLATACGLLALAKGTGMIFGLVAAVWIAAAFLSRMPFKRAIVCGVLTTLIVLSINAGHFIRAHSAFGSPVVVQKVENRSHNLRVLFSNVARNTAQHLASPSTNLNGMLEQSVSAFHRLIHLKVNDPKTTFPNVPRFSIGAYFSNEDRATAPVHLLLAIGALIPIAGFLFRREDKILLSWLLVPYGGYVLFCWLLAWQPWGTRLQIPLFCLAAPVIAYALGQRWPHFLLIFSALAFTLGLFSVITAETKPFVGNRTFLRHPNRARYYRNEDVKPGLNALKAICRQREPKTVGIFAERNRCEYLLLWNLLYSDFPPPRLITMNPASGKAPSPSPELVVGWRADPGETNAVFRETFLLVTNAGPVMIYLPRKTTSPLPSPQSGEGEVTLKER